MGGPLAIQERTETRVKRGSKNGRPTPSTEEGTHKPDQVYSPKTHGLKTTDGGRVCITSQAGSPRVPTRLSSRETTLHSWTEE